MKTAVLIFYGYAEVTVFDVQHNILLLMHNKPRFQWKNLDIDHKKSHYINRMKKVAGTHRK